MLDGKAYITQSLCVKYCQKDPYLDMASRRYLQGLNY